MKHKVSNFDPDSLILESQNLDKFVMKFTEYRWRHAMITKDLLQQAIKETAEGMLSGDPEYACKCIQTSGGCPVRVFGLVREGALCSAHFEDGEWHLHTTSINGIWDNYQPEHRLNLVPVPRKLKCWVRWYKTQRSEDAVLVKVRRIDFEECPLPNGCYWITSPIEIVAEEKSQQE